MGDFCRMASALDQPKRIALEEQQENRTTHSRPSKKLHTLLTKELPPLLLEIAEKRIDLPINDNSKLRKLCQRYRIMRKEFAKFYFAKFTAKQMQQFLLQLILQQLICRLDLIDRCEKVVLDIIQQLCAGEMPKLSYRIPTLDTLTEQIESHVRELSNSQNNAENLDCFESGQSSVFDSPESMEIDTEKLPEQREVVDFSRKSSKKKFALMMIIISCVHKLLLENKTKTRRALFYKLKSDENTSALVKSQNQIDYTVKCVANLLECSPWNTGLVATAKGLAAGNLTLILANTDTIEYDVTGGTLIPQNITSLTSIRSKADLVIVVEKDTIFQKLLQDKYPTVHNCILVTGKGYPDVSTRMLVNILAEKLELPVYILVDADPYGMDIMFTYKYGSIALCRDQESLACRSARWIGVYPSELALYKIPKLPLADVDVVKLDELRSRPYIGDEYMRELDVMKDGKAEIEAISGLTSWYLPLKIQSESYI